MSNYSDQLHTYFTIESIFDSKDVRMKFYETNTLLTLVFSWDFKLFKLMLFNFICHVHCHYHEAIIRDDISVASSLFS